MVRSIASGWSIPLMGFHSSLIFSCYVYAENSHSQPTMDPQTPTSEVYQSNYLRGQPWQSLQTANPMVDGNPAVDSGRSLERHELGHCLLVNARAHYSAAQAGVPGAHISLPTIDPQTPTSKVRDYGSPAAKSDRCFGCHELGHWVKDCSSANARAQCKAGQAGDPGTHISQPTKDLQTPISGGDYSNALWDQPWQSFQPGNPFVDGSPAAKSDRCFGCHELGHWVKDCPSAISIAQCKAAQAGDPGGYISQPTKDLQTPISEGGDFSNALWDQPWQSFQPGNPFVDGSLAAKSDRCFGCHELGHWLKNCPSVNARAQCNAAQAGDPDAYISQPAMDPQTRISEGGDHSSVIRGQPWQSVQPGNPVGKGSPAAKSDRCFRCHELGHWATDCPSVNDRAQCNAAQAGYLGAYNSQPTMDSQMPISEGDYTNALNGRECQSLKHANPIVDFSRAANSDECFRCHELGHWVKDCPCVNVTPQCNTSQGGDPGVYSIPEKLCPCGGGACLILTSKTQLNPGKKFYRCPVREGGAQCKFFQWCDAPVSSPTHSSPGAVGGFRGQSATPTQISPVAAGGDFREQSAKPTQNCPVAGGAGGFGGQSATPTQNSPGGVGFRGHSPTLTQNSAGGRGFRRQSTAPGDISNRVGIVRGYDYSTRCPCGAGPCPVRTARTDKNGNMGRQFVTCPVRQGDGSCGFFKWVDKLDSTNIPQPVATNDFSPKHETSSSWRNGASPCLGHWKKDCPQV